MSMKTKTKVKEYVIWSLLIFSLCLVMVLLAHKAFATASGPNNPGTMADDNAVGTREWANPDNAVSSNNSYATTAHDADYVSHYLKATNFGFSIPAGVTIDGILIEVEKSRGGGTNAGTTDEHVRIVNSDGSIGAENKADTVTDWPLSDEYISYGGAADLWSEDWVANDINHSNFGVVVSSDVDHEGAPASAESYVDHIRITVYYTGGAISKLMTNIRRRRE